MKARSATPGIDLGVFIPGSAPPGTSLDPRLPIEVARAAEHHGFDSVWMGDHVLWHGPKLEAITALSFAAAATSRIRVGTAVLLIALRNAVVTAKELASLDHLSGGRLEIGVGLGGEIAAEWIACGVPHGERVERTEEGVAVLRHLLSGAPGGFQSRHHRLPDWSLDPLPARPVPIVFGGRASPALERAGRLGDGWIGLWQTPEGCRAAMNTINGARADAGRDGDFSFGVVLWTLLDGDAPSLAQEAVAKLAALYRLPHHVVERHVVVGGSDDVLEAADRYLEIGCTRVLFNPLRRDMSVLEDIAILGEGLGALRAPTQPAPPHPG